MRLLMLSLGLVAAVLGCGDRETPVSPVQGAAVTDTTETEVVRSPELVEQISRAFLLRKFDFSIIR